MDQTGNAGNKTLIGQQLGNYRLISLLGRGGFADVYLGEHRHLNTWAAIKVLQVRLGDNSIEQFQNEARTIANLIHPHIIRVLDFGIENDTPFLIMDYAPNGTMRRYIPRKNRLPLASTVIYIKQVAEALQYAHDRRLIHRDIKPENILLGNNNNVLLSDFGLVLIAQSVSVPTMKELVGTAPYMAPEQIQGHPRAASDQYALGIITYEWLSGERPFDGTFMEMATQHMMAPPPPLQGKVNGVTADVERVLFTALAKDPHQRFSSIIAFANALEQAAAASILLPPRQNDSTADSSQTNLIGQSSSASLPTELLAPGAILYSSAPTELPPTATPPSATFDRQSSQPTGAGTPTDLHSTLLTPPLTPQFAQPIPSDLQRLENQISDSTPTNLISASGGPVKPQGPITPPILNPLVTIPAPVTGPATTAKRRGKRAFWLIPLAIVLVLGLVIASTAYFSPASLAALVRIFGGSAGPAKVTTGAAHTNNPGISTATTITITPDSQNIHNSFTVPAVTNTPDPSQHQIAAQVLSSKKTQTQSATATGSSNSNTQGKQATGTITFNFVNPNPTNYPAGTTFTGASGIQVVTDQAADMPATPNAVMTVNAHAALVGIKGNIPAADISITVTTGDTITSSAFSGGQDPTTSTTTIVQQSDIDGAVNNLSGPLTTSAQNDAQSQLQAGNQLVGNVTCQQPAVTADHKAGDVAQAVNVTVSVSCFGEAYNPVDAQAMAEHLLKDQASHKPGSGYLLQGKVKTTIGTVATPDSQGTIQIAVNASGTWLYQFTDAQKQALAQQLLRKTRQQAQDILKQYPGITQADINLNGGNLLPANANQITITVK